MSQDSPKGVDASIAISDPSEKNRQDHYFLDRLVLNVGNIAAWILPLLMLAICAQVLLRKNGQNQAWLDDAQWWMYGFAMIAGFAYAITTNSHVRVDIFHQHFSPKRKAQLEIFALGWLLMPFLAMMVDILAQYAWASWTSREGSDSPNGLHRLYLLKISLPVLMTLATLAAWSMIRRSLKQFTAPTLLTTMLCALPFCVFVFNRLTYHAFYLYISLTQPDIKARKIPKEPLMEYTTVVGFGMLIAILVLLFILKQKRAK